MTERLVWFSTQDNAHRGEYVFVTWESCCAVRVVAVGALVGNDWQPIGHLGQGDWRAVAWQWIDYPEVWNG
jgi:hypothetical protein